MIVNETPKNETMNIKLTIYENIKDSTISELEKQEENDEIENEYNNYTVKELLKICDFYNIKYKNKKYKKEQIIYLLTIFETNFLNLHLVYERKQLWYYINELKQNTFMKQFILW
jgi:predicted fused transcriptional regulator/phosphomethylpyrimidine kinase